MKRVGFSFAMLLALFVSLSFTSYANFENKNATKHFFAAFFANPVKNVTLNTDYTTIQAAIDAANAGDHITVAAGNYSETALNRAVFGSGSYQFGLFIDKDGLTIEGLDASGNSVTNPANAAAVVTTNATNNFGYSGIFVQANGVTIKGLKIGDNFVGGTVNNNKTIEVVGNSFTLTNSWMATANPGDELAVYLAQWDPAHLISSYTITNNKFENSIVSINNGAGTTGSRAGRVITGNEFTGTTASPYSIGFRGWNGASPAQGWITLPVGGAVVTGNSFNNTAVANYFVAAGNTGGYVESEFNWSEIWNNNTYGNHVITLADLGSFNPRTYTTGSGYPATRRISAGIQENITISAAGDVVMVGAGNYTPTNPGDNFVIDKSITLQGPNESTSCSGTRNPEATLTSSIGSQNAVVAIKASGVTVKGFTVTGPSTSFGIRISDGALSNVSVSNNIITNIGTTTGDSHSYGIHTELPPGVSAANFSYTNNCVSNINGGCNAEGAAGGIGFNSSNSTYSIAGVTISGNIINNITACAGTQKQAYGIILNVGAGLTNGAGQITGLSINNNTITNLFGTFSIGIDLEGQMPDAVVTNNYVNNAGGSGVSSGVFLTRNPSASTIKINYNSFTNLNYGISSLANPGSTPTDATCNWYGAADESTVNSKIIVSSAPSITSLPWLITAGSQNSTGGFTPDAGSCAGGLPVVFSTIAATINGETLSVDWKTLSELNNSHFDIEASKDGVQFYKIGTVKSHEGTTNLESVYNFTTTTSKAAGLMGISLAIFGLGLMFANRKNKSIYLLAALLGAGLWMGSVSCNKSDSMVETKDAKLFIRIAQVDTDGTVSYSKTVTAIRQ